MQSCAPSALSFTLQATPGRGASLDPNVTTVEVVFKTRNAYRTTARRMCYRR